MDNGDAAESHIEPRPSGSEIGPAQLLTYVRGSMDTFASEDANRIAIGTASCPGFLKNGPEIRRTGRHMSRRPTSASTIRLSVCTQLKRSQILTWSVA